MIQRTAFAVVMFVCGWAVGGLFLSGCSSRTSPRYRVEVYSGGDVVRSWVTDDSPTWTGSTYYSFRDLETSERVIVRGSCVVTEVKQP